MDNQIQKASCVALQTPSLTMDGTLLKVKPLPIAEAVTKGTLMRTVANASPQVFSAWLVAQIMRVVDRIEAKTTLKTEDEAKEIGREIYKQFPTLRMEEMQEVFDGMIFGRYGKYYERLKAAEFMEAFKQHEASEQRIAAFEQRHKREVYAVEIKSGKQWNAVFKELARRGYTERHDNAPQDGLDVCYVVIEDGRYDIEAKPMCEVVMSAKQFVTPPKIVFEGGQDTQGRHDTSKLSSALRQHLKVDPKVMANYLTAKEQNDLDAENKQLSGI